MFSNHGTALDIAAPGIDVLSLRARRTDIMRGLPGVEYEPGSAYVGEDRRYYRAGGTSFATPIVAGTASLLLSKNPDLTNDQVEHMLLHSASDLSVPGVDQFTGFGMLDARAALTADPEFYVDARITTVRAVQSGDAVRVQVLGTADANELGEAWIEIGAGDNPTEWRRVSRSIDAAVIDDVLDELEATNFQGANQWTLRLVTEHRNGRRREARFVLNLG